MSDRQFSVKALRERGLVGARYMEDALGLGDDALLSPSDEVEWCAILSVNEREALLDAVEAAHSVYEGWLAADARFDWDDLSDALARFDFDSEPWNGIPSENPDFGSEASR